MESQPQNPEFRNISENFLPCNNDNCKAKYKIKKTENKLLFFFVKKDKGKNRKMGVIIVSIFFRRRKGNVLLSE